MPRQLRIAPSKPSRTCNHSWQPSRGTRAPLKTMLRMLRTTNSQLMLKKISPTRSTWMLRKTSGTSLLCRVIWAHFRAMLPKQTLPIPIQKASTLLLFKCRLALQLNSKIWILLFSKFLPSRIKLRLQKILLKPTNPTPPPKCKSMLFQEPLLPPMTPTLSTTMLFPSKNKPSLHRDQLTSQLSMPESPNFSPKALKKTLTGMWQKPKLLSLTLRMDSLSLWTSGLNPRSLLLEIVNATSRLNKLMASGGCT